MGYTDDITATLANTSSADIFMQTLKNFEKYSGLKMNISKTKAMWIGASKNSLEKPLNLESAYEVKNNCCLFERLFKVKKNGVFLSLPTAGS